MENRQSKFLIGKPVNHLFPWAIFHSYVIWPEGNNIYPSCQSPKKTWDHPHLVRIIFLRREPQLGRGPKCLHQRCQNIRIRAERPTFHMKPSEVCSWIQELFQRAPHFFMGCFSGQRMRTFLRSGRPEFNWFRKVTSIQYIGDILLLLPYSLESYLISGIGKCPFLGLLNITL